MNAEPSAYGLWVLVVLNSAIFIMFAYSFFKPATARDWRTFGAFSAFIVALFVEMYGFPLTIYLLSGWLQTNYPGLDILSHDSGHLWSTVFGRKRRPALWRAAHRQLHLSGLRVHFVIQRMAGFVPRSTQQNAGHDRAVCAHSPSTVRGFCHDFAGFSAAMADAADFAHVSGSAGDVWQIGAHGRSRHAHPVWSGL